ncbi:RiPP maturation radical SAM C-methyltransferase [Spirochaeta isovalerica]|uniref:Ribosomal peptide maturation radical SAM protein 1 n=1 Tax=Spirochaeta isovalerica TaxID=150 RepID=A0A841RGA3_9SPIO|nr:RiPP maturation radical SAM C-methyltransferase [Spirochaeta isovalerica]MBB6482421.1 ribosomal peptide maturation radical SAM protein 1 [Spirochaeta isovalerica]
MNDILLIVPPFAMTNFPSLAAHSLQAVGRSAGFDVGVYYANLSFAAALGDTYGNLCNGGPELPGETVFASAAWSLPPRGKTEEETSLDFSQVFYPPSDPPPADEMGRLSRKAEQWIESLKEQIESWDCKLVGLTSSYEQTNASVAIMKVMKAVHPHMVTFLGGYNAEGVMAEGIASADPQGEIIDYIFSGESEHSFPAFLEQWSRGELPDERIIRGKAVNDLDDLPLADYDEYFDQLKIHFPEEADNAQLALETSRGCWWGEKSHCLFCGYADERIRFREKSRDRILAELDHMEKYPSRYGHMADLIMPKAHFEGVIPQLEEKNSPWTLYYEQRAAWNRDQLESMERAGIRDNQPGIETLSTNILSLMGKGTNLKNNLTFLREATGAGNRLYWNFVWGFPGEKAEEYRAMTELIPHISHLIPPMGIFRLALARFSPLFNNPDKWGVTNIRPLPAYKRVFPAHTDFEKLANYFICEYEAETFDDPSVMAEFTAAVDRWNEGWSSPLTRPRLMAARSGGGELILLDTRNAGQPVNREITEAELKLLIENSPLDGSFEQNRALEQNLALALNRDFVPLITIETPLRKELLND